MPVEEVEEGVMVDSDRLGVGNPIWGERIEPADPVVIIHVVF